MPCNSTLENGKKVNFVSCVFYHNKKINQEAFDIWLSQLPNSFYPINKANWSLIIQKLLQLCCDYFLNSQVLILWLVLH